MDRYGHRLPHHTKDLQTTLPSPSLLSLDCDLISHHSHAAISTADDSLSAARYVSLPEAIAKRHLLTPSPMHSQTDNSSPTIPSSKCRLHLLHILQTCTAGCRAYPRQARHRERRPVTSTADEINHHRRDKRAVTESRGD